MLRSYFTIAIRHLTRHSLFSLVNVFCLALGISFALLIGIFIIHEKGVNADIADLGNQYVIKSKWKQEAMGNDNATFAPLAKTLNVNYPSLVKNYYRFFHVFWTVSVGEKHYKEPVVLCDTTLVSLSGFPLVYGDAKAAFRDNHSAVVTESTALRYFEKKDVVGQVIHTASPWGVKQDFTITAVLKDMGLNSIDDFSNSKERHSIFLPFEDNKAVDKDLLKWTDQYLPGMIELQAGAKPADLALPISNELALHLPDVYKGNVEIELAGMKDYYLDANHGAARKLIRTLAIVAAFILVMAIINFVNIKIGTSGYRLKEIGLRKVFGGEKRQVVIQHMVESFLLTLAAGVFSLIFFEGMRPLFSRLLLANLDHVWAFRPREIVFLFLLIVVVGFVSGIYPAFVLSASNAVDAIKGKIFAVNGRSYLRRILLVIQFTLTIFVFVCTLNISWQVSYFMNKDLGYAKENLLILSSLPKLTDSTRGISKMVSFRHELSDIPGVEIASLSREIPDGDYWDNLNLVPEGHEGGQPLSVPYLATDENYLATYGLHLKEGRFLQPGPGHHEIVLNEATVRAFGWGSATGKRVKMAVAGVWLTVVGVVSNFNFASLHQKVQPLALMNINDDPLYRYFSVRLRTNELSGVIAEIRQKWTSFFPDSPFDYTFMDEKVRALYQSEDKMKTAAGIITIMTLLIVLLGIFGVVSFTLMKRAKEIAVRKIMGAGVANIIVLFIRNYAVLIVIANLIAWPLAYIFTERWLNNYAYRVNQNIVSFLSVTGFVFFITFLLITAQCFKVASANPINNIRTE